MSLSRLVTTLVAPMALGLLAGCPRAPAASDAGPGERDAGEYDPVAGNRYEGPISFDDVRVTRLDPATLQGGAVPCRRPILGRVTSVTDGDTFDLSGASEIAELRVRMIGIDAPEVGHDGRPADCYGDEAAAFTRQLEGRLVWLTFDTGCQDGFGRTLAYVWIGGGAGDLWQRQILRRGFGRTLAVPPNLTYSGIFEDDRAAAEAADAGLWGVCP